MILLKCGYSRPPPVIHNKDYDVMISAHDVTNKVLSLDSNYIVDKFMRPKFVKNLSKKTDFFEGWSWFQFTNLGQNGQN